MNAIHVFVDIDGLQHNIFWNVRDDIMVWCQSLPFPMQRDEGIVVGVPTCLRCVVLGKVPNERLP